MRELVYLSERKLHQFQHQQSPGRLWRRVKEVGAKAPLNLGEIRLGLSEHAQRPDLARILQHIDNSDRPPRWFAEEGIHPGEWVQFDARLNYKVVRGGSGCKSSSALLFWEPLSPPAPAPVRLLLHGSPEHLVAVDHAQQPPTEKVTLAMSHAAGLVEFLDSLNGKPFSQALKILLSNLDERFPAELASWMTGYARVTANILAADPFYQLYPEFVSSRVVVASPLYVEYATASEST